MGNILIKSVNLSGYTTIRLGGVCNNFVECNNDEDIIEALKYSQESRMPFLVLSGGSNTIFADKGYEGIILHIRLKGIGQTNGFFTVRAGENWDSFVIHAINKVYSGIECLSGIPGSVGATPIQNVGAYGQEVSDVIHKVRAINTETLEFKEFDNSECDFSYRSSRFKTYDKGKYIITDVIFKLPFNEPPIIRYKELEETLNANDRYKSVNNNISKVIITREAVLSIRAEKSMIYSNDDYDSYSCGSFFVNPVLNENEFKLFSEKCKEQNLEPKFFKTETGYKIPAAWLIENSGFRKGHTENGIGISSKHTLALVNRGGTTKDLIKFSEKIVKTVYEKFGIKLSPEPEIIY